MHRERKNVVPLVDAPQTHPHERPTLEVERLCRERLHLTLYVALIDGVERPRQVDGVVDHDARRTAGADEARAKRLVSGYQISQARAPRSDVQLAREAHRARHIVGRAAGIELLQKPQPRLPG